LLLLRLLLLLLLAQQAGVYWLLHCRLQRQGQRLRQV
jgi:hypothetical protein